MNILSIESSSSICGTALFINNKLVDLKEIEKPRIHGRKLPVIVNEIMNENSIFFSNIDAIAVSSGPGSFTGLRIGMSLARGLAYSHGIAIIPVPTLSAMNINIKQKGVYWIILHSHKNNVYVQRFKSYKPDSEIRFEEFNVEKYKVIYGFNLDKLSSNYISTPPSAKSVGKLALINYDNWLIKDLNKVSLNYIENYNFLKNKL